MKNLLNIQLSSCQMITTTVLIFIGLVVGCTVLLIFGSHIKSWFREIRYNLPSIKITSIRIPHLRIPRFFVPSPAFSFVFVGLFGYFMFVHSADVKPCPKHPIAMMIFAPKIQPIKVQSSFHKDTTKIVADCGCN